MKILSTIILVTASFAISFGQNVYMTSKSNIHFTSDAPLEVIEATSTQLQGALKTDDRSFVFRAPMNTFEGFNSALQKTHFNTTYLETSKFPYTLFEGKIIEEVDFKKPGTYQVRGKGRFTCHGVEQERIIKCTVKISNDQIEVTSDFTVLLDDHNIKIPSVVNQKIAEEILVKLELVLVPKK
jgi:hypothetical protein